MDDPLTKAKRQHLKRKILQYRWLKEMGFDVSSEEAGLLQRISNSEFSLSELGADEGEGEIVDWRCHPGSKGMLRPIILSNLAGVIDDDSIREESEKKT